MVNWGRVKNSLILSRLNAILHPGVVAAEYSGDPWGGGGIGKRTRLLILHILMNLFVGSSPTPSAKSDSKVMPYFDNYWFESSFTRHFWVNREMVNSIQCQWIYQSCSAYRFSSDFLYNPVLELVYSEIINSCGYSRLEVGVGGSNPSGITIRLIFPV